MEHPRITSVSSLASNTGLGEYFTLAESARCLGLTQQGIRALIERDQISFYGCGRHILFTQKQLVEYILNK